MKTLFTKEQLQITLQRLARQLIEDYDFANTVLIGMQPRGVFFSDRIYLILKSILKSQVITYGKLDVTFYRDDYAQKDVMPIPTETDIPFSIEGKHVILIDDVLFTGRTIRSGLEALIDFGRPESVKLLTLIDRRFSRELPIQPDYIGISVDTIASQKVKVLWQERDGKDEVVMIG